MKQKRISVANMAFEQMKILKTAQSLGMDTKLVERLFGAFEKNAGKQFQISFNLALDVLKKQQNLSLSKSQLEDYFDTQSNTVEFPEFCKIYVTAKKIQDEADSEEIEIINSFVALGGQPDKTGIIKKAVIINIIKNQFELTFDIEQLLDRNGDAQNLDYDAFSQMFIKVQQSQKDFTRASFTSILTSRGKQEQEGLKIRYQDFENWLLLNGT